MEAAEMDVWDSQTPACPEGKNIRMSEDVVPSSSSPELKSTMRKKGMLNIKLAYNQIFNNKCNLSQTNARVQHIYTFSGTGLIKIHTCIHGYTHVYNMYTQLHIEQ